MRGVYLSTLLYYLYCHSTHSTHDMCGHLLQDAIDFCCPGDARYATFCYCDFYAFADSIGYKSDKMAGW